MPLSPFISFKEQPIFRWKPEFPGINSQPPSTPQTGGRDHPELIHLRKQKITEIQKSPSEQTDNHSVTWAIELENDILPSESSSIACNTTVVIDTVRDWGGQQAEEKSSNAVMNFCSEPRSIATRTPGQHSHPSLRVASRFFPNFVSSSSLRDDISAPRTLSSDWEDRVDGEPELLTSENSVPRCLDVGRDHSPTQETDSFLDGYCGAHISGACSGTCTLSFKDSGSEYGTLTSSSRRGE